MTTSKQDESFIAEVISGSLLEESIEWIKYNLEPEEVFSEKQLKDWVTQNLEPDDAFPDRVLRQWAVDNGFRDGDEE